MTQERHPHYLAWLACPAAVAFACKGGPPSAQLTEAVRDAAPADARRFPPACGDLWDELPNLWAWARTTLEAAIRTNPAARVDDRVESAFRQATRRDAALDLRVLDIAPSRVAVFAAYECGALAAGGRLWLLAERRGGRWDITDEVQMSDGEHVALNALAPDVFALLGTRWGTQAQISTLRVVRAATDGWRSQFDRSGMIDVAIRTGSTPRFAWAEPLGVFGESMGAPRRTFEGRIDPQAGMVTTTPTSPWLDALDAWCRDGARARHVRPLCSSDNVVEDVRLVGGFAAATLAGRTAEVDCQGEAPASWIAADRRSVVELSDDESRGWHVVDVRSDDRGCSMGVPPLAPSRAHVVRRRGEYSSAAHLFLSDGHTYWVDDGALMEDGAVIAPLANDVSAVARAEDGTIFWVAGLPGQLWTLPPGGARRKVAELPTTVDGLVIEGGRPFWSSYPTGKLFTLAGDTPQVVVQGLDQPWGIAVQGADLLVATATGIRRIDTTSGQVQDVDVPAVSPVSIAVTDDAVVWTEAGGRVMLAETNQAARGLATGGRPRAVAVKGRMVVWTDASDGTIRRATF